MKKLRHVMGLIIVFLLFTVSGAQAAIDWGTTGVADTSLVKSILQLTPGNPLLPEENVQDWVPCWGVNPWSKDGQWIVYQSRIGGGSGNQQYEICIIKKDGTGWTKLTDNSLCDSHGNFTPNGNKIVFQREADPSAVSREAAKTEEVKKIPEIWIMDKDGSNQVNLTQVHGGPVVSELGEQKPLVSPDGSKILFRAAADEECENSELWVMNIDGTNPIRVSGSIHYVSKHSWSPDGQWILFSSGQGEDNASRIYKVRQNGTGLVMLSEEEGNFCENWAAWSPNGQWISYHRRDHDANTSEIWIMNTDGSNKRVLIEGITDEFDDGEWICGPHSWHPSSQWIVFKKNESGYLHVINVNSGDRYQLTVDYNDGRMWWGPDGITILFKEKNSNADSRDGGDYHYDLLVANLDARFLNIALILEEATGNCFIATAAFGSPLAGQVTILRQFRDRYLLTNAPGRSFVAWYYQNGPVAAAFIQDKPLVKLAVQAGLYPLVGFSFLLINGFMPFVMIGFALALAGMLFFRFRSRRLSIE